MEGEAPLPIRPVRGQLLRLRWPGAQLTRVVWSPRCYVVPWRDGSLLVGATVEEVGFDERATVSAVTTLLDAVCDLLPGARDAGFDEVRVGLRPGTPDDHALDKVLNLRGVSFEWKKDGARNSNPQQGVQIGFVAQEVETVVPELVKTDSEGYKSVAYANVTALLIEAVKEQQKTIAEQRAENKGTREELSQTNAKLNDLKIRVSKLESQFSQTAMLNK